MLRFLANGLLGVGMIANYHALARRGDTPLLDDDDQARKAVALVRAICQSAERGVPLRPAAAQR